VHFIIFIYIFNFIQCCEGLMLFHYAVLP